MWAAMKILIIFWYLVIILVGICGLVPFDDAEVASFVHEEKESIYAEVPTNVEGINDFDARGRTYLIDAVLANDVDAVKNYIIAGARVDLAMADGNTALLLAAKNNLYLVCMELINAGANMEHKNDLGITALLISVIMGHKYVVQSMLDHGADVNVALADNTTAVMLAAQKGRDEILSLLLAKGADVYRQTVQGTSALMFACMSHQVSTVRLVLAAAAEGPSDSQHSANENFIDRFHAYLALRENSEGGTALHYAASRGLADIIYVLVESGADMNALDSLNRTPVQVAIHKRQQSAIEALAILGANLPRSGYRLSKEVKVKRETAKDNRNLQAQRSGTLKP